MKCDTVAVTLFAVNTAEGMARACRDYAENGWPRCPVGWYFVCPLVHLGDGRCGKVEAKDWEAVMQEVQDDPQ
jgi:hypothetical protein